MTAVRVLAEDEYRAAHRLFAGALLQDAADDAGWERTRPSYPPGRVLGVDVDGELSGTAMSFAVRTAVPGGAALPTAAVTRVGVRADRTRRGLLSALMARLLADARASGEVLASLRASEARIYGRFGYGTATRGRAVAVRTGGGLRATAPAGGTVRLVTGDAVVPALAAVHDALALRRAGGITRPRPWWAGTVGRRLDRWLLAAVHRGPAGDDGFAVAAAGDGGFAERTLRVLDLHAGDDAAAAGLWRFLLGLDLAARVEADLRPLDEPLDLLLADPRDVTVTGEADETWLRLVDVPAALAARSWGAAPAVRIAVHDRLLPGNTGVYRIGPDGVERTAPDGPADLECDVAALAAAYLGDRAPSRLAATGWWRVHSAAALPAADALFATGAVPWCGTFF